MTIRNLAACRWIITGDLLSISRQRRGFIVPALMIGLAQVTGMSLVAIPGTATLLPYVVLALSVLMAAALSLESVIRADVRNGMLQQLLLAAQPRPVIVLAKCLAHWLLSGAPCIALTLLCGLFLRMSVRELVEVLLILLVVTPTISIGATALGMRQLEGGTRRSSQIIAPIDNSDACLPSGSFWLALNSCGVRTSGGHHPGGSQGLQSCG